MNETFEVEKHVFVSSVLDCEMAGESKDGVSNVLLFEGSGGLNSSSKYEWRAVCWPTGMSDGMAGQTLRIRGWVRRSEEAGELETRCRCRCQPTTTKYRPTTDEEQTG